MDEKKEAEQKALIKAFDLAVQDLANGGQGVPWNHPDYIDKSKKPGPEMI